VLERSRDTDPEPDHEWMEATGGPSVYSRLNPEIGLENMKPYEWDSTTFDKIRRVVSDYLASESVRSQLLVPQDACHTVKVASRECFMVRVDDKLGGARILGWCAHGHLTQSRTNTARNHGWKSYVSRVGCMSTAIRRVLPHEV
jgi:hypothetical protein